MGVMSYRDLGFGGLRFRVEGLGSAGEVARSGVKRPWPYACFPCEPTPPTHTTFK